MFDWKEIEFNRFGIISLLVIIVGCMGGIAVGFDAIESTFQTALAVGSTMAVLVAMLAVTPMKWIINLSIIAVVIDLILLAVNNIG